MKKNASSETPRSFDVKLENFLQRNSNVIFYIFICLLTIFSFLYFNARASIAGDDSTYITRAMNFWESGTFPTYQGPLYPIVLSLFVGLSGMNLVVLKLTSFVFILGFVVLLYHSYKGKIPHTALFFAIAILSVSHLFLFFSSQTYSEPLFLVLQGVFFLLLLKKLDLPEAENWKFSTQEHKYLLSISLLAFLMYLTRTVGFGAILSVCLYFLLKKNYKRSLYLAFSFSLILFAFISIKSAVWDIPVDAGEQTIQLLNKHPYDSSKGKEDIAGFISRFKDNSNLYLSKHFLRIIGLRSTKKNTVEPFLTVLLYAIFISGFFWYRKRNNTLYFTSIYLAIMLGITFFSLQKLWDQYRLIIPFVPLIILFLSSTIIHLSRERKITFISKFFPAFLLLSLLLTLGSGTKNIDLPTLSKNLNGDKLAGYTPDWVNYLQMVEFVEGKLPKDSYVACRKPNIARIYGNRKKFYGIYRIPSDKPDELLKALQEKHVTHIIMGSLRKNPKKFTGQTINTIRRYMSVIAKAYPNTFRLIKQYGDKEPAYLFEIDYNVNKNSINKELKNNN